MAEITVTGTLKRAIRNVPMGGVVVRAMNTAAFGVGEIAYLIETAPPIKVDSDGTINGAEGFELTVPTVASGDLASYAFGLPRDNETLDTVTLELNDATDPLTLEEAIAGGTPDTGGTINVSGKIYLPFSGLPYPTGFVRVQLVERFVTDDGIFLAVSEDIKIDNGDFNGSSGLTLYVPDGQSEWLFTFPDGTAKTAMLGTHTSMVEIADIANGDYATALDPMNVPTSFNAVQDGVDVDLTWTDTNTGETGYRIERSDDDGATWDAVTVTAANATSYTNTSVPADSYIYRIRAEKSGGQSAWVTDTVTVTLFSPDDLADLVLWLDASDATTLFQDTAGTSPVTADAQSVARWDDKSASTNNVTQGTSGNRPTRQTSGGYVGVRFDGTNDNLAGTVINVLTNISLFCVVRLAGTSISGAMVKNGDSGDGWGLGFGDSTLDGDGNNLIWLWEQLQWRATTSNTQTGKHIEAALITGGNGSRQTTLREDGAEIYDQPSSDGNTPTAALLIGGYFRDTDRYFNHDILEVLIYTQALDPTEVGQVETYLASKWGITL